MHVHMYMTCKATVGLQRPVRRVMVAVAPLTLSVQMRHVV